MVTKFKGLIQHLTVYVPKLQFHSKNASIPYLSRTLDEIRKTRKANPCLQVTAWYIGAPVATLYASNL
jgi:hypothetical protein